MQRETNLNVIFDIQSRFPTTAMREDVGRSIGLSARKVQVCVNTRGFRAQLLVIDHVSDLVPGEKKYAIDQR